MVCCSNTPIVNDKEIDENPSSSNKMKREEPPSPTVEMDEFSSDDDKLKIKRLAGGSIVDYPPLFSPNGESIFIIFGRTIRIYSTTTGEFAKKLEGSKDDIIALQYDPQNSKYLIGCSKSGEIIKWKWKSGAVEETTQILLPLNSYVQSFNFLNISEAEYFALITTKSNKQPNVKWMIVDIATGRSIKCSIELNLTDEPIFVTTEIKKFHYFAIAQGYCMHVVNYKNWKINTWKGLQKVPFTYIQSHPTEEMIVTGDKMGRIVLWRQLWSSTVKKPITTLYHWHHTAVTCIEFTTSGSTFYSSGEEAVLVKWNISQPDLKDFLPRRSSIILQIRCSEDNRKVAICTADNAVLILGSQNKEICVLQEWACVIDKKTGLDKFPIGLRLNPRTNCLVLNGVIGYLQFFSTYTKSLLYNMDIVIQNQLSKESKKILYDTQIVKAAFNIDWMVTGEVWDDQEHAPEVRLKFWQYLKENQSYSLNSNIESPHENGFHAIEFSHQYETDNLLCATVGKDNFIKIWSLEDSDNIYKKGKIWYCMGQTNYKNMTIQSISFSQDGSILAAGFNNCLCIYKVENLKLKTILTAPSGLDGALQKIQISVPSEKNLIERRNSQIVKNEAKEKRQKALQLFKDLIENNEGNELIKQIHNNRSAMKERLRRKPSSMKKLTSKQEEALFRKIHSLSELNLFQKLSLYQKLEMFSSIPKEYHEKFIQYLNATIFKSKKEEGNLLKSATDICKRYRFKAKYKLQKYISRKRYFSSQINEKLVPVMNLLNINTSCNNEEILNSSMNHSKCNGSAKSNEIDNYPQSPGCTNSDILPPLQSVSCINSVHFATGEFAHLVVICTEHRVLVWNLLTLRLQCVLKLSVHKMIMDPITNLFAAFTKTNELYIFLPNTPMAIYSRRKLPPIHGACWVPKRYPKTQSINLDWQAVSTLFFLTEKQELMFLASDSDVDIITSAPSFLHEPDETLKYSTFGTFAIKQINAKTKASNSSTQAIGVPGKAATKQFIDMTTHAMAPVNLLCNEFLKSLLNIEKVESSSTLKLMTSKKQKENAIEYSGGESDIDIQMIEINKKKRSRKFIESILTKPSSDKNLSSHLQEEQELQKICKEKMYLSF